MHLPLLIFLSRVDGVSHGGLPVPKEARSDLE